MKSIMSGRCFTVRSRLRWLLAMAVSCAFPLYADDVLFFEDFENPDVPSYSQGITPDAWVRAAQGYGSSDHGMTDKSGGDFSAPSTNMRPNVPWP